MLAYVEIKIDNVEISN